MPLSVKVDREISRESYFGNFSILFIPEYGGRTAFYAFRSSTWPSGGCRILRRVEGPFTLRLSGSGEIVQDAGRRCAGFISGIRGEHLGTMRC